MFLFGGGWFLVAAFARLPEQLHLFAAPVACLGGALVLWRRARPAGTGPWRLPGRATGAMLVVMGLGSPAIGWTDWSALPTAWAAVPVAVSLAAGVFFARLLPREYDAGLAGEA